MWQVLLTDVIQISKQVAEQTNQLHSIALQSSLPRIIKVRKNLVQTLFMKKSFKYFPQLNYSKEFVKIRESIKAAQVLINITKRQCTIESMQEVLS